MSTPKKTLLLLVYVLCTFRSARSGDSGDTRPCSGSHCPGGRSPRPPRQHNPTTQSRSINQHHAPFSFPSEHHATFLSQRGRSGDQTRETVQTRVAGVFDPVCADCVTPHGPDHVINDTRECKGIECRLPLRIRQKPRSRPCAGDGCVPEPSQPPLIHVADRAAQFLGEFPDIGYPASEVGAPLGVQLTCDIKPGDLKQWFQLFCTWKWKLFFVTHSTYNTKSSMVLYALLNIYSDMVITWYYLKYLEQSKKSFALLFPLTKKYHLVFW